ncbi:MAG: TonB-dependent receptor [Solimonas sp.]
MDTATSAVVLDEKDIEKRGLQSSNDVLANTPNVVYLGTGNAAPSIRGVDSSGASKGTDAFIAGSRPRINTQLDGRPLSYYEIVGADTGLWDIEQVEVLRGAQSTLQGRNAIAGTIAMKTADPKFAYEGAARVGGGDYDQHRASGMLTGPIGDGGLAFRLSADYWRRESANKGYEAFPSVEDPGAFEYLNLRGKMLFEPASIPGWRALVTLNHSDYQGPQAEGVLRPFGERQASTAQMPTFEPKSSSAIVDTSYDISDALRFEGTATGTRIHFDRRAPAGGGVAYVDGPEYTVEPRLRFGGDGRLSGVAGLYLFAGDHDEMLNYLAVQNYDDHVRTAAVFGEATVPLGGSPFDLVAGARYEQEKHERLGGGVASSGYAFTVALDKTYKAFLPKLVLAWHVDHDDTLGFTISRGYNGGGAGASIYTSYATNYEYDPEYVWTYELYSRHELLDGRLRVTANAYYSDYKDYQLTYDLTPTNTTDYAYVVDNAGKVETWGAEAGATWLVVRGLDAFLNLGTQKTDISKYPDSGYQGHELPNAAKLTGAAGVDWTHDGWEAGLNARYAGSYYSDVANLPRGRVGRYWIANAQLGYRYQATRLYGSVRNLFDSDKPLSVSSGSTASSDIAYLPQPRTYWVGLELRW